MQPVRRSGRLLLLFCVTCVEKDRRRDVRKRSMQWPPGACAVITNAPKSPTPCFAPHAPTYTGRPQLRLHSELQASADAREKEPVSREKGK